MAMSKRDTYARHSKAVTRTKRWAVLRQVILERDGWKCRCCGDRRRLEIDHIQPVRLRPDLAFEPRNLQALCPRCHTKKTRLEVGHKEKSPARKAWDRAVAELATNPNPAT
ncbi:HNH endonuclease [Sinirhodobacter huangdaonensis]|uniref:HNH endonuclease n=2 Tax=Paenirhodobacter huangdaonensis TaxID=2501515 RepID=A0A3S3LUI6_9RHOB|nr:HNH endonuclease [Sinirhodobacter huangdaonensis]